MELKAIVRSDEKLKFLIKKFGFPHTAEYLDGSKNIEKAFAQALYAEHVVDCWLEKARRLVSCQ